MEVVSVHTLHTVGGISKCLHVSETWWRGKRFSLQAILYISYFLTFKKKRYLTHYSSMPFNCMSLRKATENNCTIFKSLLYVDWWMYRPASLNLALRWHTDARTQLQNSMGCLAADVRLYHCYLTFITCLEMVERLSGNELFAAGYLTSDIACSHCIYVSGSIELLDNGNLQDVDSGKFGNTIAI